MNRKDKSGVTNSAHLEQVAKVKGEAPPELEGPPFPEMLAHQWEVFLSLHAGRSYGMAGGNPLTWEAIYAWCNLTRVMLSPWEVDLVKALDATWMEVTNESDS